MFKQEMEGFFTIQSLSALVSYLVFLQTGVTPSIASLHN